MVRVAGLVVVLATCVSRPPSPAVSTPAPAADRGAPPNTQPAGPPLKGAAPVRDTPPALARAQLAPASRASAGGACSVGEAVVLGKTTVSPRRGAGVLLSASATGRWAAWRADDDHVSVQPLGADLQPVGAAALVAMARPRGRALLVARDAGVLLATHAMCNRRAFHCIGLRWLDRSGAPITEEWEHRTQRGESVSVQTVGLIGTEILAYTYRYWDPLILEVPAPPDLGTPTAHDLTFLQTAQTIEPARKLALVPSGGRDRYGVLAAAQVATPQGLPWLVRWFPGPDEPGVDIALLAGLSPEFAPTPPIAVHASDGVHVAGWEAGSPAWRLRFNADGTSPDGPHPVAGTGGLPEPFPAEVQGAIAFRGAQMRLRRSLAGGVALPDTPIATPARDRGFQAAAGVAWLGSAFGVVVAEFHKPAWTIVGYRVQCDG